MKTNFILWLLLLGALPLGAAQIEGADRIVVTEPRTADSYLAGRSVSIEAPVWGDLVVAASDIWIRDTVTGDVQLAVGNAAIEAPLADDLRAVGGKIRIDNAVTGDVFILGGEVELTPRATIGGDVYLMGGSLILDGTVLGDVKLYGGKVILNGRTEGGLKVRSGDAVINGTVLGESSLAATELRIGDQAAFYQPVRYWRKAGALDFGRALANGAAATYDEALKEKVNTWTDQEGQAAWAGFYVLRLAAAALSIVVFISLFGRFFNRVSDHFTTNRIGRFIGLGLLLVLLTPLVAGLAFVTVIGIPLALTLSFLYLALLGFAHVLTAIIGAYVWRNYRHAEWTNGQLMLAAFSVFVALKLLSTIPLLGWLISALAVLVAFGILVQAVRDRRHQGPAQPLKPTPAEHEVLV